MTLRLCCLGMSRLLCQQRTRAECSARAPFARSENEGRFCEGPASASRRYRGPLKRTRPGGEGRALLTEESLRALVPANRALQQQGANVEVFHAVFRPHIR